MVCADWRAEHGASPVAVCKFGREEAAQRTELEHRRLGRHGTQDCAIDPDDEEQGFDTNAMESGCVV